MGEFLRNNWFDVVQTVGIIGSLILAANETRTAVRARKISNLNAFADRHREIWKDFHDRPDLARVLQNPVNLNDHPLTGDEEFFVSQLIIHLNNVHQAIKAGMSVTFEKLPIDIEEFFSLPIPRAVWEKARRFQEYDFAEFIDTALQEQRPR